MCSVVKMYLPCQNKNSYERVKQKMNYVCRVLKRHVFLIKLLQCVFVPAENVTFLENATSNYVWTIWTLLTWLQIFLVLKGWISKFVFKINANCIFPSIRLFRRVSTVLPDTVKKEQLFRRVSFFFQWCPSPCSE